MSWQVRDLVETTSGANKSARTVAMVLGGVAHHDGVAWATIGFRAGDPEWKKKRSIAYRAGLDERQVRRALDRLHELDELETLVAYDGRRRFYVHRLIVGALRATPVDYDRELPRLAGRFWTPAELRQEKEKRSTAGHVAPWITRPRADSLSGRHSPDEWTFPPSTSGHSGPRRVDMEVHSHFSRTSLGPSSLPASRTEGPDLGQAGGENREEQERQAEALPSPRIEAWVEHVGVLLSPDTFEAMLAEIDPHALERDLARALRRRIRGEDQVAEELSEIGRPL